MRSGDLTGEGGATPEDFLNGPRQDLFDTTDLKSTALIKAKKLCEKKLPNQSKSLWHISPETCQKYRLRKLGKTILNMWEVKKDHECEASLNYVAMRKCTNWSRVSPWISTWFQVTLMWFYDSRVYNTAESRTYQSWDTSPQILKSSL